MKYSKKQYEEMRAMTATLHAQMMEIAKQAESLRKTGIKELTDVIRANPNSTAKAISEMMNREFSSQAIGSFGHYAEYGDFPSIPNLRRKKNTKVRHFVEVDDDGNILPGTQKDVESTFYTYSIRY